MLPFILSCFLNLGLFLHPFFVSVTEIRQNEKTRTLEISCRIFYDDLERTLEKNNRVKIDILKPADRGKVDALISAYLQKQLQLKADGQPVNWKYLGYEIEEDAAWCYLAAVQKYSLELILLAIPGSADFEEHKKQLENILRDFVTLKPILINTHTGRDYFTFEQNRQLILLADKVARETKAKIIHETHRGRFSYAAPAMKPYLEKLPDLRLTLDISHWCNVAESLLENQTEVVNLALSRTDHIHSRVGHAEGPQVNDPRAPEWDREVKAHLAWWDKIVDIHRRQGSKQITITTEFGPANYLPTLPYTRQPVARQWDINVHMLQLLKKRYEVA